MKRHIPNFLTLLNVFAGSVAVIFAAKNEWETMAFLVLLGLIFDFSDGLAARKLKVQSELGLQLDSLADVITFGLVPGVVMFQLLSLSLGGEVVSEPETGEFSFSLASSLPFFGFVITMSSALRLGRFNIDENQTTSFIGLPTPANALLIVSLPMILLFNGNDALNSIILNPWFLVGLTVVSSVLLNAQIHLFSLKFKSLGFKENALRYVFIIVSLFCIGTMKFLAVPAIIVIYLMSSLLFFKTDSSSVGKED
ncbi:CDP-alcohol phosphatidyltransferase family protein [Muriicola soli]|uniref:Phosphatidylserine synthase n=1 Tax=Muriicola soli TaxID=2507538 RepID=A0A411E855_9FLAO|nr:CDP-alcohol phosphatidyltransferase family protein [Muriicola soli]QBA63704.1 phosphatidylserine synthase [Muriicola soli]